MKRLLGGGVDLSKLKTVIEALVDQKPLDDRYRDHSLVGVWKGRPNATLIRIGC